MFKTIAIVASMLFVGASSGLALRPDANATATEAAVTCPCGECETGCGCCAGGDCTCEACVCAACDSQACGTGDCCADGLAGSAGACDAPAQCSGSGCDR